MICKLRRSYFSFVIDIDLGITTDNDIDNEL